MDNQLINMGPETPPPGTTAPGRNWVSRWLSMALIAVGIALLGAAGVMAYLNFVTASNPPPPVGMIEPASPPSLEENPLPVVVEPELPRSASSDAPPTSSPSSASVPLSLLEEADSGVVRSTQEKAPSAGASQSASEPQPEPVLSRAQRDIPSGAPARPKSAQASPAENPPTRIVAPAIDLDAKVIPVGWKQVIQDGKPVSVWEVAEYAAGWHENTSLPGNGGNIVLSGHHNIKGEVFRYIVDLEPGDTITLYADNRPYTYTVESRFVVRDKGMPEEQRRENGRWIGPFPDERVTLVTCWPYTDNTHRVIVIAKPAP